MGANMTSPRDLPVSVRRAALPRQPETCARPRTAPPPPGPLVDRFEVGACRTAEPGDGRRLDLVLAAFGLRPAEPDPCHLGEQVAAASRYLAQFRSGRIRLRVVQRAEPGQPPGRAGETCDENPVSLLTLLTFIDHAFEYCRATPRPRA